MLYLIPLSGYMLALFTLIIMSLSVESMFIQWTLLELNMLCFIPILVSRKTSNSTTNALKYFIAQSAASFLFLITLFSPWGPQKMSTIMLLFKMGLPPFQSWLMSILSTINLFEMLFLMTIQKAIPLIMLSHLCMTNKPTLLVLITIWIAMASLMDSVSLFKLMFISSTANMAWTIAAMSTGLNSWITFFIGYTIMFTSLIIALNSLNINSLSNLMTSNFSMKLITPIQFFNLAGLPPLVGFILKLSILTKLTMISTPLTFLLLAISFLVLFMYTSIFYQASCFKPNSKKFSMISKSNNTYNLAFMSTLATVFGPMIII